MQYVVTCLQQRHITAGMHAVQFKTNGVYIAVEFARTRPRHRQHAHGVYKTMPAAKFILASECLPQENRSRL